MQTNFTGKIVDYFTNAPLAAVNAVYGIAGSIVKARNKAAEKAAVPVKSGKAGKPGKPSLARGRGRPPKTFPASAPQPVAAASGDLEVALALDPVDLVVNA